jgi:hypothetical protein
LALGAEAPNFPQLGLSSRLHFVLEFREYRKTPVAAFIFVRILKVAVMDLSIRERLESLLEPAASHRRYIPDDHESLKRVITRADIQKIIENNEPRSLNPLVIQKYVQIVLDEAFKITVILVLLSKEHLLVRHFIHKELLDRRLPLAEVELQDIDETGSFAKLFSIHQYDVLAPHFRKGALHRALDERYVLPFRKDDPIPGAEGAFGTVFKVEIHTAHQSIDASGKEVPLHIRPLKTIC